MHCQCSIRMSSSRLCPVMPDIIFVKKIVLTNTPGPGYVQSYKQTLFLYLTLTTIPDEHIYQDNNKIATKCIFDFLNLPFFSNHYHPLQSYNIPAHVLNSNTLFGQRLNEDTSKRYLCCSAAFT